MIHKNIPLDMHIAAVALSEDQQRGEGLRGLRPFPLYDFFSALFPGKALQRLACELYIPLTEPGVHKALVAANHTNIKAW